MHLIIFLCVTSVGYQQEKCILQVIVCCTMLTNKNICTIGQNVLEMQLYQILYLDFQTRNFFIRTHHQMFFIFVGIHKSISQKLKIFENVLMKNMGDSRSLLPWQYCRGSIPNKNMHHRELTQ